MKTLTEFLERKKQKAKMKILILIISVSLIGCSTHRVILGEMEVWGSNEIRIDTPVRK